MVKKTRKILPWLLILALLGGTIGLVATRLVRAEEQASTSGTVNNVAPLVSGVNLTDADGGDIVLTANTTTTVYCTGTITDENGGADITSCTAVIYRSGVGANCKADNNNCYFSDKCQLGTVSGNNRNATATADIYFHADPTDSGTYKDETWQCQLKGIDVANASSTAVDSTPPELNTLIAVSVSDSITYDALNPGTNMSNLTKVVNATTTGNAAIDLELKGDNMTSGENSIPVGNQRYSTTTDDAWENGTPLTSSYVHCEMEMPKPNSSPSTSTDTIYWGWGVPGGTPAGTYSGINYFNPIPD